MQNPPWKTFWQYVIQLNILLPYIPTMLLLLLLSCFSVSHSVWPHRRQLTRLPRPWNSPGKNTGVGCHFLLQCSKVKSESEVAQSCPTFSDPMDCSLPGSSIHGIFQARVLESVAITFSVQQCYSLIFTQISWKFRFIQKLYKSVHHNFIHNAGTWKQTR